MWAVLLNFRGIVTERLACTAVTECSPDRHKTEFPFQHIEIPIGMEQRQPMHDAVGANNHVYGLARRNALAAKHAVVLGCFHRDILAAKVSRLDGLE